MNKVMKKMFLSIITLLLTLTAFASSTFAWMSMNSDAWVEGMEFQATGGEGFMISTDGKNYKSTLTNADIYQAIVYKYNSYYVFSESGTLIDPVTERPVDYESILKNNIKLLPVTSNGSNTLKLSDLLGVETEASSGRYIEFDIYFSQTVENAYKTLNIYLNGEDYIMNQSGGQIFVPKTNITSNLDFIRLTSNLTSTVRNGIDEGLDKKEYFSGQSIKVRASNAIRLGITSNAGTDFATKHQIVELTDEYDLGSYATNNTSIAKYDAQRNAMYTYYNGLKNNSLIALEYTQKPNTITSLTTEETGTSLNEVKICTLDKEHTSEKVTFKIWLEGWDADCLEGISKQIQIQMSFKQR